MQVEMLTVKKYSKYLMRIEKLGTKFSLSDVFM